MATEAQTEIEMQLDLFEQMMNDDQTEWDLYADDELKESDPTPSEEERQELEQDLIEIALQISLKKYTFVHISPSKKLFQKCQQSHSFNRII